jgi:hypothetical protein
MTFHQNPLSSDLNSAVSNDINGREDDVLLQKDHEENSSCDESVDSN